MSQESLGRKKGVADIVFLIDCSGSMKSCLNALTQNVGRLIETMVNPGANAAAVVSDWRAKVCGYRDAKADGDQWWSESVFTSDMAQVKADLAALEPKGGGDEPESLLDALWKLAKMRMALSCRHERADWSWAGGEDFLESRSLWLILR